MSLARKIDKYRVLKRVAAENRHLRSRLAKNLFSPQPQGRVHRHSQQSISQSAPATPEFLHTRACNLNTRQQFESRVSIPVNQRCKILSAVSNGETKEASELHALTEALRIFPSSSEWNRVAKSFDSDVFATFTQLLQCCDAAAAVHVMRRDVAHKPVFTGEKAHTEGDYLSEYKATVALEVASENDEHTAFTRENRKDFLHTETEAHIYDLGVGGEWTTSVRSAIKMAVGNSVAVLEEIAAEEWRTMGREAATLLNEMRSGGCCTDDFDVAYLNAALGDEKHDFSSANHRSERREAGLRWTVSVQRQQPQPAIFSSPSDRNSTDSDTHREALVEVLGAEKNTQCSSEGNQRAKCVKTSLTFKTLIPVASRNLRSQKRIKSTDGEEQEDDGGIDWVRRCLAGALLMGVALQGCTLHRRLSIYSVRQKNNSTRGEAGSCLSVDGRSAGCASSGLYPSFWKALPLFACFSNSCVLENTSTSPTDDNDTYLGKKALAAPDSPQNVWHCPDVVVMLAELRAELQLPHYSYPVIEFVQKAVHDSARRVRELSMGRYGDVDVFTAVHIRWTTAQGTFCASAKSDPAKHAVPTEEVDGRRKWLMCEDTGFSRGPLPLLVAAVCSLYDQVRKRRQTSLSPLYPLIPLQEPHTRHALDFLCYSWFDATPQIRCFAIGTAAPKATVPPAGALSASVADGFTQATVGASMTRAMLFYDILGQRVLFAETHAAELEDAVARLNELAVEVNCLQHDHPVPTSAVHKRPFRAIARQQQWEDARRAVKLAALPQPAITAVPTREGSTACSPFSTERVRRVLRRCTCACGSELGALWTVVEVLTSVVFGGLHSDAETVPEVLTARFNVDVHLQESAGADNGELEDKEEALLWVGRRHVPWNSRPFGKEITPPRAGVVELRWTCPQSMHIKGQRLQAATFRCRVDSLSSCGGGGRVATGVLPALTLLCREALQHVYAACRSGVSHGVAASCLPPLGEVLGWCAEADPVLARLRDGFPPFDARFYAAPKLLGELLQGVAGKYACSYAMLPQRDTVASAAATTWASPRVTKPPPLTSTVFYASTALDVDARMEQEAESGPWSARGRDTEASGAPPAVLCTLFIDSVVRSRVECRSSATFGEAPTASAEITDNFTDAKSSHVVLGRGVGRTKREAWRSAAWQALRLQFPRALVQVELLRSMAELAQRPDHLNLLRAEVTNSCEGARRGVPSSVATSCEPPPPCSALPASSVEWEWTTHVVPRNVSRRGAASLVENEGDHHDSADSTVVTSTCTAYLICADGTRAAPLVASADAASAAEAWVQCATAVLQLAKSARRATESPSLSCEKEWGGSRLWSSQLQDSSSPSAASWSPSTWHAEQRDYARWRLTTHYAKSVWHAYAGALSAFLDRDCYVELIHFSEDDQVGSSRQERRSKHASLPVVQFLTTLQVRARETDDDACLETRPASFATWSTTAHSGAERGEPVSRAESHPFHAGAGGSARLHFTHTPATLLARRATSSSSLSDAAKFARATRTLSPPAPDASLLLVVEVTMWLAELAQQCPFTAQTCHELRGLLQARLRDIHRIQHSTLWGPAERVEAILTKWTGCHTSVRVFPAASVPGKPEAWAAEVLLRISVRHAAVDRHTQRLGGGSGVEAGLWVAGSAEGKTSDDALWALYRLVCAAVRSVESAVL